MTNFWGSDAWGTYLVIGVLLGSLLVANMLKRSIPFLRKSLIPHSVLAGILILLAEGVYKLFSGGEVMFDAPIFGADATATMEVLTYHTLALGFIASSLKSGGGKLTKKRTIEIFNTGVTTVSTYLLQAVAGFGITILASFVIKDFFKAAGVLLPFGYGQGTGQAMNYGTIYETEFGFEGGKSFGLTVAALGFLSASIGGVIHLNWMRRTGRIKIEDNKAKRNTEQVERENEVPMQESIDKLTIQVALIAVAYILAYVLMYLLGLILPGMKSVIYGFNFLLGVLAATVLKGAMKGLKKVGIIHREYLNDFLLTRTSNFFFDLMVVAGIAAIRLDTLEQYWGIMLILGVVGLVITYAYNYFVAKKLFPEYVQEQFLMMYGMLTGTASTGTILLREADGEFKTPAADNMVYQNFPAIVFGFPMMLLATLAPKRPYLTLIILFLFFVVMNVILFRSFIFKKKGKKASAEAAETVTAE